MSEKKSNGQSEMDQSKRTLVKAAWAAPVIVALTLPRSSFGANMSGTSQHKDKDNGKTKRSDSTL